MSTPHDVKARVAAAYNSAADFYDHAANSFWGRFGQRTIKRLNIRPGSRVLDLCCGSGASALPAAVAIGPTGGVVAVDLADDLIQLGTAKAQQLGLTNVEFRVADLMELDEQRGTFDEVVCVFGIFFVPDQVAALRQMWSFVRDGGRLAVTTWGSGVFEPVNSAYWNAVRRVRPELCRSFNPWDQLGEPRLLQALFDEAGCPSVDVTLERGSNPITCDDDVLALLMGTGYRGVIEQLSEAEWAKVKDEVLEAARRSGARAVSTDVIYAQCVKEGGLSA